MASASGISWGNWVARVSGNHNISIPATSERDPASKAPSVWVGNCNQGQLHVPTLDLYMIIVLNTHIVGHMENIWECDFYDSGLFGMLNLIYRW